MSRIAEEQKAKAEEEKRAQEKKEQEKKQKEQAALAAASKPANSNAVKAAPSKKAQSVAVSSAKPKTASRAAAEPSTSRSSSNPAPSPPANSTPKSTANSKASALVNTAKQYLGVKYLWGGATPQGFDCSGFVKYVYARHGITLPRVSRDQFNTGTAVAFANLQPADLVFFSLDGDKITDHVGMYIGNGQFIHASSSKGVTISSFTSYWQPKYLGAKRIL
jgi:cell wall-associated NlpC family hydrolase